MKRNFLKIVLPVFAFTLAIAFSFANQETQDEGAFDTPGWIQNPDATQCAPSRQDCTTDPTSGILCTDVLDREVYKKNSSGNCTVALYEQL